MASSWWGSWFTSGRPECAEQAEQKRRRKLQLEGLEERLAPAVALVSTAASQTSSASANNTSSASALSAGASLSPISDDGRYVVFLSQGTDLVSGQSDSNGKDDVFLRDNQTGDITLISHNYNSTSTTANGTNAIPTISGDGKWVAFWSDATDLIDGISVPYQSNQLYLWSRASGDLTLVTHAHNDTTKGINNGDLPDTGGLAISDDGKYVVYVTDTYKTDSTSYPHLVKNYSTSLDWLLDAGGYLPKDAYLYNRSTDTNTLVSHTSSSTTTGGDNWTTLVNISGDGSTVVFSSSSANLLSNQSDDFGSLDVFRYDVSTGGVSLVTHKSNSSTASGHNTTLGDGDLFPASISDDGKYIAYASYGKYVASQSDSNSAYDAFLYDVSADTNYLISHSSSSSTTATGIEYGFTSFSRPVINGDGTHVVFSSSSNSVVSSPSTSGSDTKTYLYDVSAKTNKLVSYDSSTSTVLSGISPTISDDGSYVTFATSGTSGNIYRYKRSDGSLTLISHATTSDSTTTSGNAIPVLSGDGTAIVWDSTSSSLVANDKNSKQDVFLYKASSSTPTAPTSISLTYNNATATDVPEDASTWYATISTDTPNQSLEFSLVNNPDNLFAIANPQQGVFQLKINNPNGFPPANPNLPFKVKIRAQVPNNAQLAVEKEFSLGLVSKPTDLSLSIARVPGTASTTFATLTTASTGTNRTFNVELVTGTGDDHNNQFKIVKDNGVWKLQTGPNFPPTGVTQFKIRVRTTDTTYSSLYFDKQFSITLVTPPTAVSLSNSTVPALTGKTVGTLNITATPSGRTFLYSLVNDASYPDNQYFQIGSDGKLTTDTDMPSGFDTYTIQVRVTDPDYSSVYKDQELTVTALTAPKELNLSLNRIPAAAGARGGTFSTTADGDNRQFTYSLVTGDGTNDKDNGKFTINSDGQLVTKAGFPTSSASYSIRVRTADSTFPELYKDQSFTITAVMAPSKLTLDKLSIPASTGATGGQIGVEADGTGRTFDLALVQGFGDNAFFAIQNGKLVGGAGFPKAGQSSYTVKISVADHDFPSLSTEQAFSIDAVKAATGLSLSVANVPASAGATGGTFSASGTDLGSLSFSLVDAANYADNAFFKVDGNQLKTGDNFPDGTRTSYTIKVRVANADYPDLYTDQSFDVTAVLAPTRVTLSPDRVPALPGKVVGALGTEANGTGRTFTYTLVPGDGDIDNDSFDINSDGQLVTKAGFPNDFATYSVRVRTTDTALSDLYWEEELTITALPAPAELNLSLNRIQAADGAVGGTFSTVADGTDRTFSYSLVSGAGDTDNGKFDINSDGQLVTKAGFPTSFGTYSIRVRTTDTAYSELYKEQTFTITTQHLIDEFDRSDSSSLTGPWVDVAGDLQVVGDQVASATQAVSVSTLNGVNVSSVYAEAAIDLSGGTGAVAGLYTRMGPAGWYRVQATRSGANTVLALAVFTPAMGVQTLATRAVAGTLSGTLRLETVGNSQKVFFNGNLVLSTVNGSLAAPGTVGIRAGGGATIDDFQFSELPATAALPLLDQFTNPVAQQLDSGDWQELAGNFKVAGGAASNANAGLSAALLRGVSAGAAFAQASIDVQAGSGHQAGLYTQFSSSGYYRVDVTATAAGAMVSLVRYTPAGGFLTLTSTNVPGGASGVLRLETMRGTQKVFLGDALLLTAHDSSLGAGTVGIKAGGTAGTTLDNFQTGELAPTASLPFRDQFNTATAQQLDSGNWVESSGNFKVTGGNASSATPGISIATLRASAAASVYAEAAIDLSSGAGAVAGLYTRMGPGGWYRVLATRSGANTVLTLAVFTPTMGIRTLARGTVAGALAGTLRLETVGNSQKVFFGGSLVCFANNASVPAAGTVGILAGGGATLIDFNADNLASAASLPFQDTFTSPTAQQLDSGNWVESSGNFKATGGNASSATTGISIALLRDISATDVFAEAAIDLSSGTGALAGLYTRMGSGGWYRVDAVRSGANTVLTLAVFTPAMGIQTLGTKTVTGTLTGTLRLTTVGNSQTVSFGGTPVLSASNKALTTGGAVGIRAGGGATLDDFKADSVTI